MAYRWKVFTVVSVGVFMSSLDLFIVNIAFPDLAARLRRHEPRRALLGPVRLRDRVRRAARPRRPDRRPRRAQARVPRRARRLHRRLRAVRRRPLGGLARRGARPPGGGRRLHGPDLARAAAARVPARAARHRGRALGRRGRRRGRRRPADRRPARRGSLALGVPGQPAGRPGRARGRRRAPCARSRARRTRRGPTCSARCCSRSAIGAARARDRQGRGLGLGQRPRSSASFAAAALLIAGFVLRSARHPAPVVELPMLRVRSFAVANLGDAAVLRRLRRRCCSPASLFLTERVGLLGARGRPRAGARARSWRRSSRSRPAGWRPLRPARGGDPGRAALRARLRVVDLAGGRRRPPTPPTSCPACSSAASASG